MKNTEKKNHRYTVLLQICVKRKVEMVFFLINDGLLDHLDLHDRVLGHVLS